MKKTVFAAVVLSAACVFAADKKKPNWGYTDTPRLPSGWRVHDVERPQPGVVTPAPNPGGAPSDAIVLFDGSDASAWKGTKQPNPKKGRYNPNGDMLWKVENGYLECTPTGDIMTKEKFGDCQLHIEYQTAVPRVGTSQESGNSGIFLQGRYEFQVLDSFDNRTYADGMAGAMYGMHPPLVNACREPGEWQVYDIIFQAPRFDGEELVSPACATVFFNGVLIHHKQEFLGLSTFKKVPQYKPHGEDGLKLQDHRNNTRFRNIWIRRLDLTADDSKPEE